MKPSKETRWAEGRNQLERSPNERDKDRTQSRGVLPPNLARVNAAARKAAHTQFTALLHHVNVEALERAFRRQKRRASAGVDGITVTDYEQNLGSNLEELCQRIHTNRYRPQPVRRYISRRQMVDGVHSACRRWKTKSFKARLSSIYEVDFMGFSYGFRPGRNPHQALSALHTAIMSQHVNWVLDADIRSFLDVASYYTFSFFERVEEVRSNCRYLNSYAFCPSAIDVNGLKLAALYTLQDGLPRDAE
ncbi:hypothetical protein ACVJGD_000266 [Bradyrhizobium sp. USDA 10063]